MSVAVFDQLPPVKLCPTAQLVIDNKHDLPGAAAGGQQQHHPLPDVPRRVPAYKFFHLSAIGRVSFVNPRQILFQLVLFPPV